MRLDQQTAIITGGAGAIGRATALRLAADGVRIAICDIRQEQADAVAQEIEAAGGQALALEVNLLRSEEIDQMTERVLERWGRIDILVNSAGGSARKQISLLQDADEDVIDMILGVNLRGVIFAARSVLEPMIAQKSGKIVNIGSIVGVHGKAKLLDYTAAKAGVIALTKTLAMEVGEHGINVNCVSPGIVPRDGEAQDLDYVRKTNYLGRVGKAEDIANMTAFLVSDQADFITGQNFIVDGGRSLGLKEN